MANILGHSISSTRLVRGLRVVQCERCDQLFFYEIIRSGSGSGFSLFFLDNAGAHRRAAEEAVEDARRKCAFSRDPVPCPACGHIQADAIREAGKKRVASLLGASILLLILSIVVPFMFVYASMKQGSRWSDNIDMMVLTGTPGALIAAVMAFLCWRAGRRFTHESFINLPEHHPTKLAPPALLWEPEGDSGTYIAAAPIRLAKRGDRLLVQPFRIGLPPVCMMCCAETDRQFKPPIAIQRDSSSYPCCEACQRTESIRWWMSAAQVFTVVMLIAAIVGSIPWPNDVKPMVWGISLSVGALAAVLLGILVPNLWRQPLSQRRVPGSRGWVSLRAREPAYQKRIEAWYSDRRNYELDGNEKLLVIIDKRPPVTSGATS